jgi:hypothetical protein
MNRFAESPGLLVIDSALSQLILKGRLLFLWKANSLYTKFLRRGHEYCPPNTG